MIIERKRDGAVLTDEEIGAFVSAYAQGGVPDYQMSAFAMAVFFRGMTAAETASLTRAMLNSGSVLERRGSTPRIDKHSTGGVGDKLSLVLAPLAAACGLSVPMIAGRGLGLTGGTIDKLEAIPGFRARLEPDEINAVLDACGCVIACQGETLAPVDRRLYPLRDVTGTALSVPLIVASILSKKLAENLDGLVMNVMCGRGAFMHTTHDARELARALVATARTLGLRTVAVLGDMNHPLGATVGNALEVEEAIAVLRGGGPVVVREAVLSLGIEMLRLSRLVRETRNARAQLELALDGGAALDRFRAMVRTQGGDERIVDDPALLPHAKFVTPFAATAAGVVVNVDAEEVARTCMELGAGRSRMDDLIDPAVGLSAIVPVGTRVEVGAPLALVHANDETRRMAAGVHLAKAFELGESAAVPGPFLLERIT
ncbi:MAG: thymidine phosphorylase [bacterium]